MKTIVKMIFGSHLYGTDTPDSDRDYKGIFLPSKRQVFLNNIPKSIQSCTKQDQTTKNTSDDVDTEMYSLHYFLQLACKGETAALDMLHCPDSMLVETSDVWRDLVENRSRFYTRNLSAFVGYARRQASKYGIKGSRLNDCKQVIQFLYNRFESYRLSDIWSELPEGEHIDKAGKDPNGIRIYEVCGRKLQETCTVAYCLSILERFYENYGERAKKAARNEGIDWKAVSHALRAAYQVEQVLAEGTITFPLRQAEFLRQVKTGQLDYMTVVAPKLEEMMDRVERLSEKSSLPSKVDRNYWNDWLYGIIEDHYGTLSVVRKICGVNNEST